MKNIKVKFVDMGKYFNLDYDPIFLILKKHYNVILSEEPDYLFYSCRGTEHLKYENCVRIFSSIENVLPNFNVCDYGSGFDYLDFGDRYFRMTYMVPPIEFQERSKIPACLAKRKFCNFIYSNSNRGEGSLLRQEFCKKLMKYKKVDCPGLVLNNMKIPNFDSKSPNWTIEKLRFINQYKFTIAFENSKSNGYTTEKLYHPFMAYSLPIYWGNALVDNDFNSKAFINADKFDDFDALIDQIIKLDNDDEKYLSMLREKPLADTFDFERYKKFEQWICYIIDKGNTPYNKDPLLYDETCFLTNKNHKNNS
ncbi:MAG: glycosyltransferase family 10 [Alphaproteobacteria bacterium]|nr:glycosyltransferase family 10 [Alphaproteobacteria bacterium]